ncbi:MAG: 2-C-methyl-D-erythritol 2,4-cyclodiphosphate synthase [Lachnospiraceae bacterium]|nr:2-C-methyl-D-erythritol 2,4-cyclodiphosphate synthase [Lachnospiraceae bacterium]
MRVGMGYDVHKLGPDRDLIIGGVKIPFELGLVGHSDADVLLHAIMDAMLGAAALGDIGKHFPDTDDSFKGIDSMVLLKKVLALVEEEGYFVGNIDATIIAQKPKMRPYIEQMRENIADALGIDLSAVNVKATTEEGLGFTGAMEGISAQAVCMLISPRSFTQRDVTERGFSASGNEGRNCAGCSGCPSVRDK